MAQREFFHLSPPSTLTLMQPQLQHLVRSLSRSIETPPSTTNQVRPTANSRSSPTPADVSGFPEQKTSRTVSTVSFKLTLLTISLDYMHWEVSDESSTTHVTAAPSSFRPTPGWAKAIDDFRQDEHHLPCTRTAASHRCKCAAACASQPSAAPAPRQATPGPSNSGTLGHASRSLQQASIVPYLIGRTSRAARPAPVRAHSPGRSAS